MHHTSSVTIRKVDPDVNMHRQYTVTVGCDLFGTPLVICRWGRIGTSGQVREHVCTSSEAAHALAARLLSAKERRGYGQGRGGVAAAATRKVSHRKPAAKLRRQACVQQLWLFDLDAPPTAAQKHEVARPQTVAMQRVLSPDLVDLPTVSQQRRAPLTSTDRKRRLDLILTLANKRGLSLALGAGPSRAL